MVGSIIGTEEGANLDLAQGDRQVLDAYAIGLPPTEKSCLVDPTQPSETRASLTARTLLLGDRLDTRGLERIDSIPPTPLALRWH